MHRVFSELSLNVTYHVEEKFKTKEIYGAELPIRLSITKLHPTAYGHQITIKRRKQVRCIVLRRKMGKQ